MFKKERMRHWLHVLLLSSAVFLMRSASVDSTNVVDLAAKLTNFTLGDLLFLRGTVGAMRSEGAVKFSTTFSENNSSCFSQCREGIGAETNPRGDSTSSRSWLKLNSVLLRFVFSTPSLKPGKLG